MKLTYEQIKDTAVGYVYTQITEKGIEFHRFSKTQEEKFYEPNRYFDITREPFFDGYFGRNCRTGAGVKLDFYTDAKSVTVKIGDNELTNVDFVMQLDTLVNGKKISSNNCGEDFTVKISDVKKRRRVEIYMTTFNFTVISGIELEEASFAEPAGKGIDVLALGDSITHGAGSGESSVSWVNVMSRKTGLRVLNQANSGYVFDAGVLEKVCSPKIITVAYGINDQGRKSREDFEKDADEYVSRLKKLYPEAKIVGIVPIWTEPEKDRNCKAFTDESRSILKRVYEKYGVYVVDGLKMMPNNQKYLSDVVHPNEAGHTFYGRRMAKILGGLI